MTVTISAEDREVLADLANELKLFKQKLMKLSIYFLVLLKKYIESFIISLGEYSPQEIKKHGLEAIMVRRAMRFFGLAHEESRELRKPGRIKKNKLSLKRVIKNIIVVPLLPLYFLILMIYKIRRKNKSINVKNQFKT